MADRQQVGPAVLVVHASSAVCGEALDALVAGRVEVVIGIDELDLLPDAVAAAAQGFAVVSTSVVDGALRLPALSEGDRALLALVADGASNDAIATALGRSTASVKREVVRLCGLLDVPGRPALIGRAKDLGF